MKYFNIRLPLLFVCSFLLLGCSPHPGTGVWQSSGDNEFGFSKLIIAFEGKAEFTSTKPAKANWHCFWGKKTESSLSLDCTSSTNTDQSRTFIIITKDKMTAEFHEGDKLITTLKRLDENPVLAK